MACYLLRGENGVIIHYNFYRAEDCKRYIRKGRIKKYECFEEAEAAALEHLENIVPYYIQIPDHIKMNEMITRAKLFREDKEKEDKK